MSRFTIGILGRDSQLHSSCFEEVAKALAIALRRNGHELTDFGPSQGRLILFGTNNVSDPEDKMPRDAIIFNTEQVAADYDTKNQIRALEHFKKYDRVIWDYSTNNIAALKKVGVERVVHCPIGYIDTMTTLPSPILGAADTLAHDIDVLFYGSTNPRRLEILDALDKTGLNVVRLFGVYGEERDNAIQRAKVVLNLHFYERPIFEIFRVSHLLSNAKCVITEDGGCDNELEAFAKQACVYVSREKIVDACVSYAKSPNARAVQALGGYLRFMKIDFVENVKKALEQSGVS